MAHCSVYMQTLLSLLVLVIISLFIVVGLCVKATLYPGGQKIDLMYLNKFVGVLKSSGVWFWLFSQCSG